MNDERVTFKEKYNEAKLSWQDKAVLISLYHTAMCMKHKSWTLNDTAQHFEVSIGLVSENIKLAKLIDNKECSVKLMNIKTRDEALKFAERRKYPRITLED